MTYLISIWFQIKQKINQSVFNMIKSKALIKHISCKCKCKFDSRKYIQNQKSNIHKYRCTCENPKNHEVCEKDYIGNPATCSCENVKYLASIFKDSVVTCDEIMVETKAIPTKTVSTSFDKK